MHFMYKLDHLTTRKGEVEERRRRKRKEKGRRGEVKERRRRREEKKGKWRRREEDFKYLKFFQIFLPPNLKSTVTFILFGF